MLPQDSENEIVSSADGKTLEMLMMPHGNTNFIEFGLEEMDETGKIVKLSKEILPQITNVDVIVERILSQTGVMRQKLNNGSAGVEIVLNTDSVELKKEEEMKKKKKTEIGKGCKRKR